MAITRFNAKNGLSVGTGSLGVVDSTGNIEAQSLGVTGSITPASSGIYDIGSPARVWRNLYVANISGSLTGSGLEQNSIVFAGPGGVLTGSLNNFSYNPTTGNVAIGTNVAMYRLEVGGDVSVKGDIIANGSTGYGTLRGVNASITNTLTANALSGSLTKLSNGSSYLIAGANVSITTGSNGAVTIATSGLVGGSGTTNYVPKWNSSSTLTNSNIFDDGTNVGIGTTTSLSYKLQVQGTSYFSNNMIVDAGVATYRIGSLNTLSSDFRIGVFPGYNIVFGVGISGTEFGKFLPTGLLALTGSFEPGSDLTYDIGSTAKKWRNIFATNISGSLTGSNLSAGQVIIASGNGVLSGTNNLFWENTNGRLGIGTSTTLDSITVGSPNGGIRGPGGESSIRNFKNYVGRDADGLIQIAGNSSLAGDTFINWSGGNVRFFHTVAGDLRINGDTGFVVNTSRNVGVGTSTVTSKFLVSGSSTASTPTVIIREGVVSPTDGAEILDVQNSAGTSILVVSGSGTVGISNGNVLYANSQGMKLDVRGNIGITNGGAIFIGDGTSFYRRLIAQDISPTNVLRVGADTAQFGTLTLSSQNSADLFALSQGNVGIGSTAPTSRFFVSGSSTATTPTTTIKSGHAAPTSAILDVQDNNGTSLFWVSGSSIGEGIAYVKNNIYIGSGTSTSTRFYLGADISGNSYHNASSTHYFQVSSVYKAVLNTNGLAINNSSTGAGSGVGLLVATGNVGIGTTNPRNLLTIGNVGTIGSTLDSLAKTFIAQESSTYGLAIFKAGATAGQSAGNLVFGAQQAGGVGVPYAQIGSTIEDATAGATRGNLTFSVVNAGALTSALTVQYDRTTVFSGSANPDVDLQRDLGSTTKRWRNLYVANISGSLTGSGLEQNSIVFAGAGGVLTGSLNQFSYNPTTGNVAIGKNVAMYRLDVGGSINATSDIYTNGTFWGSNASITNTLTANALSGSLTKLNDGSSYLIAGSNVSITSGSNGSVTIATSGLIGGSGTTNYVPKFTGTTTLGNSQIYDDGTNVGIGALPTTYKLEVRGGAFISGSQGLAITTSEDPVTYSTNNGGQTLFSMRTVSNATGYLAGQSFGSVIGYTRSSNSYKYSYQIAVDGNGVLRYRSALDANNWNPWALTVEGGTGNVGIGTTTVTARLLVAGSSTASTPTMIVREGVVSPTDGVAVLNVQNSAGTSILFVSGSGAVGVGVTVPNAALEVNRAITFSTIDTFGQFVVKSASGTTGHLLNFGSDATNGLSFIQSVNRGTNATPLVLQRYGGNVGIGTSNVQAYSGYTVLDIDNATNGGLLNLKKAGTTVGYVNAVSGLQVLATSGNDMYLTVAGSNGMFFRTNAIDRMTINSAGTVAPGADNTYDFGSSALRWRNVFATSISGSLTGSNVLANQVVVAGTGGVLSGSYNLFWDNSTNRLGIGHSAPSYAIDARVPGNTIANLGGVGLGGALYFGNGASQIGHGNNEFGFYTLQNRGITFNPNNTFAMSIVPAGRVGIGGTNPLARFEVTGSGNTSSTSTMHLVNSSNTSLLFVRDDGSTGFGTTSPGAKVDINTAAAITSYVTSIRLTQTSTTANSGQQILFYNSEYTWEQGAYGSLREGANNSFSLVFSPSVTGVNTERVRILSNGNVGIGITNPTSRLEVLAATEIGQTVTQSGVTNSQVLALAFTGGAVGSTGATAALFRITTNSGLRPIASFNDVSVIDAAGSFAIGATSTTARLLVSGSTTGTSPSLLVRHGIANGSNLPVVNVQDSAGTSLLFVSGSGNVGIGISTPNYRLHVEGVSTNGSLEILRLSNPNGGGSVAAELGFRVGAPDLQRAYVSAGYGPADYNLTLGTTIAGIKTETIRLTQGNVGIGTTLIDSKLVVNGNSVFSGSVNPDTDNVRDLGSSSKRWRNLYVANISGSLTGSGLEQNSIVFVGAGGVLTGSVNNFSYNPISGNVAIGTNVAMYRLEVGGDVSVKGDIIANGSTGYGTLRGVNASITNTLTANALSGSLTKLSNGTSYLIAGANVSITSGSNGSVTIATSGLVGGSGTTNYVPKWSSSSALTNSNIFDDGTNVGVGTNNPLANVHVNGAGSLISGTAYSNVILTQDSTNFRGVRLGYDTSGQIGVIASSNANSSLAFWTNSGGWGERMRLDSAGNLLVRGTTQYGSAKLQVVYGDDSNAAQGYAQIGLQYFGGGYSHFIQSLHNAVADDGNAIRFYLNTAGTAAGSSAIGTGNALSYFMGYSTHRWNTGGSERVRIDSSGNVGVGTTSILARLHVSGSSTASTPTMIVREGVANPTGGVGILNVQNSAGTSLFFVSGSGNVGIRQTTPSSYEPGMNNLVVGDPAIASTGITLASSTQSTLSFANGTSGGQKYAGYMQYSHGAGRLDFGSAATTRMSIRSDGNVGIGGTNPVARFEVTGSGAGNGATAHFVNNAGTSLIIVRDNGTVGIGTTTPSLKLDFGASGGFLLKGNPGPATSVVYTGHFHNDFMIGAYIDGSSYSNGVLSFGHVADPARKFHIGSASDANFNASTSFVPTMTFTAGNNVGIGTTTPGARFEVTGSSSTSSGVTFHAKNSSGTSLLFVRNDGNVGIGTTLIDSKLVVNGNSVFSGSVNPDTDNVRDLGSSSKRWRNLYVANISGSLTGSGLEQNSVVFAGSGGVLSGSLNQFSYNPSTGNVAIGKNVAMYRLDVGGSINATSDIYTNGTFWGSNASITNTLTANALSGSLTKLANGSSYLVAGANVSITSGSNGSVTIATSGLIGGSGTTNYIPKFTGASTLANSNIFDDGANIGIGTSTPGSQLDVRSVTSGYRVQIGHDSPSFGVAIQAAASAWARYYSFQDSTNNILGSFGGYGGSNTLTYMFIGAAYNNTALRADPGTGNVSVGNVSGTSRFYVLGSSTASTPTMLVKEGVASPTGGVGVFDVQNSAGTSLLFVTSSGGGNVGIGTNSPRNAGASYSGLSLNGSISGFIDINTNGNRVLTIYGSGNNAIFDNPVATGTTLFHINGSEKVRIDSSGNVGIGTNNTNGNRLAVSGGNLSVTGSVLPGITNTYDLGSVTYNWRDLYARSGSFSGDLTVTGNLTVAGTQTIVNSDVVNIKDNAILLNAGPSPLSTGGIYVADTVANVTGSLIWDTATDQWKAGRLGSETTLVSGSGTDSYIAKWVGSNGLGNSVIYDNGTNVGINTTTVASYRLNINAGNQNPLHMYTDNGTATSVRMSQTGQETWTLSIPASTSDFSIASAAGAITRFTTTGNVGIGTNTVTARLLISGSSTATTPTMIVREGVVNALGGAGIFDVQISTGTSLLFVTGSGNVGVGTITPAQRLHIVGRARIQTNEGGSAVLEFTPSTGNTGFLYRNAANSLRYDSTAGVNRLNIDTSGHMTPGSDDSQDIGSATLRWRNIYATSISGSLTGSNVAAGQVVIAGTGGVLSGSNDFFWDNTNRRIGIGTSTSLTERLHVNGNIHTNGLVNTAGTIGITPASNSNISLNTSGTGSTILSGLYYTTAQSIAVTLGTDSWIRLATVPNLCDLKLHIKINSTNTEESINVAIKGNYYNVNTKIDVDRVTYAERLREVWVDQPTVNGGPKIIYIRVRSSSFSPTVTWWLYDSTTAITTIHNDDMTATPPTSGISVVLSTSINTQQLTNANIIVSGSSSNPSVGIGINNPSARLHINAQSGTEIARFGQSASSGNISFYYNTTTAAGYIGNGSNTLTGAGTTDLVVRSEGALLLASNGNTRAVTINTSQNVGIGTGSPLSRLQVVGVGTTADTSDYGILTVEDNSANPNGLSFGYNSTAQRNFILSRRFGIGSLTLAINETAFIKGYNTGVGIGVTNPSSTLQVSGSSTATTPTMIVREGVVTPLNGVGVLDVQNSVGTSVFFVSGSGKVGVGTTDFSYPNMDNTPLVGSKTNNVLYANGSIQLNGNNDAIVFGRSTSTFLKDEELGFGWGSGWYMTDSTWLRTRNNGSLFVGGGGTYIAGNSGIGGTGLNFTSRLLITGSGATNSTSTLHAVNSSGTSLFFVRDDGNVGIGINTPATLLNIRGSSATLAIDDTAVGGTSAISFRPTAASYVERAGISVNYSTAEFRISAGVVSNVYYQTFYTNGSERLRIDTTGNVGIGTTLIDSRLVVNGNSVFSGSVNPDGDLTRDLGSTTKRWRNLYVANISGSLTGSGLEQNSVVFAGSGGVLTGSLDRFSYNPTTGNVAIGTNVAMYRVDVVGDVSVKGDIIANGSTGYGTLRGVNASITNTLTANALSGSLTKLNDGSSYLIAGTNISITSASNGSVTIATANLMGGSGTTNYVAKFTGTNTIGNSTIFDNGTSVGIGTATPQTILHINGPRPNLRLQNTTGATSNWEIFAGDATAGDTRFGIRDVGAATSRIVINAGGGVGIGTTNPTAILHASDSDGLGTVRFQLANTNAQGGPLRIGYFPDSAGFHLTSNGNPAHTNNPSNSVTRDYTNRATFELLNILGSSLAGTYLDFRYALSSTFSPVMRIQGDGSVGIGTTTLSARLHVSGSSTSAEQTSLIRAGVPNQLGPVFEVEDHTGTTLLVVSGSGVVGIGATGSFGTNCRLNVQLAGTARSNYTAPTNAGFLLDCGTSANGAISMVGGGALGYYFTNSTAAYDAGMEISSRVLTFRVGNASRVSIDTSGNTTPAVDNTQNLGSSTARWANVHATSVISSASLAPAYTTATSTIGDTAIFDTISVATDGAVYELMIVGNPNSNGSLNYRDIIYGKVIIGTGYDGAVRTFIQFIAESPPPRSLYTSGGGPLVADVVFFQSGSELTKISVGTTATIRVKISGYYSGVGGIYVGVNTTVRLKQLA